MCWLLRKWYSLEIIDFIQGKYEQVLYPWWETLYYLLMFNKALSIHISSFSSATSTLQLKIHQGAVKGCRE